MLTAQIIPGVEKLIPLAFFALYLITSVQIVRYSSWIAQGRPNPFLPERLKSALTRAEVASMLRSENLVPVR